MIKTIIFDVGGVIIDYTEDQYIAYLSKKLKINQHRLSHVLLPLIDTMEYGRMDLDHAEKIFADHFNISQSGLEWVEAYKKIARKNKKVVALVKRLSKNYKIGIITNVSKSRYRESCRLALNSLMKSRAVRKSIVSCYVGLRKPSAKIYRLALRELGSKSKETLFIDNMQENVVGARGVGMYSIQFKNYKQLLKELRKLGVS
jgi:putative hydrolase of the HAD superfamily